MYTATNIIPPETIHKSCNEIQNYIEAHYDADNPSAVVDRANNLESYLALSSKLVADSQYHYDTFLNSAIITAVKEGFNGKLSPSSLNKYIDTLAKDYKYLAVWSERINRCCVHQLDMMRTMLSKLKTEMYNSQRA